MTLTNGWRATIAGFILLAGGIWGVVTRGTNMVIISLCAGGVLLLSPALREIAMKGLRTWRGRNGANRRGDE